MTRARLLCWALLGALLASPPVGEGKEDDKLGEEVSYDVAVERVEVDVLVLDRDGQFVTGLKGSDFEISEEGKRVEILDFEERDLAPAVAPAQPAPESAPSEPAPPARQPRRFIIFVDLLNTGISATQGLKPVLMRFVNETLGRTDEVMTAVLAPDGRTVMLHGFTASRAEMVRAFTALRGNGRMDVSDRSQEQDIHSVLYPEGRGSVSRMGDAADLGAIVMGIKTAHSLVRNFATDENRRSVLALDSVASLVEKVEQAGWQTGRKSVIYFSQGLPIRPGQGQIDIINRRIEEYNRRIEVTTSADGPTLQREMPVKVDVSLRPALLTTVGRLNRFGATLYTIDARGSFQSASSDPGRPRSNLSEGEQQSLFFESQETLNSLAIDTGGIAFYNRPNLASAMIEIERDNRSRYFLTYKPPAHKKGKKAKFYRIEVKCKQPGTTVRARKGYLD